MELFKTVNTFNELIDLNIKHLKKEINWVPYHQKEFGGTINPELIQLNEAGFLTITGQCYYNDQSVYKKIFIAGYIKVGAFNTNTLLEYFINYNNKIKTNISDWDCAYNSIENHVVCFNPLVTKNNKTIFGLPFRNLNYINDLAWGPFENIKKIIKGYCYIHIQSKEPEPLFYTKILDQIKQKMDFGKRIQYSESVLEIDIPFENTLERIKYYYIIQDRFIKDQFNLSFNVLNFNCIDSFDKLKKIKKNIYKYFKNAFIIKIIPLKRNIETIILKITTDKVLYHRWFNMPMMYHYVFNVVEKNYYLICEQADTTLWDILKEKENYTHDIINNIMIQCFFSIQCFHKLGYIHNDTHTGNFLIHEVDTSITPSWTIDITTINNLGYLLVIWDFDKSSLITNFSKIIWDYIWQFPEYLIFYEKSFKELDFRNIILDEWGRIINYSTLDDNCYREQFDSNKPYIEIINSISFDEGVFISWAFSQKYTELNVIFNKVYTFPKKSSFGNSFDKDICYLNNLKT